MGQTAQSPSGSLLNTRGDVIASTVLSKGAVYACRVHRIEDDAALTSSTRPEPHGAFGYNIVLASAADLLRLQWERSCERLLRRLEGLTDDEYRWEPVANCWNVRPDPSSPSGWRVDYPDVHPDPPPFTTIAWRLLHLADGNTIYWEHRFGPRIRNFWDLVPHGDAGGAIDYLIKSQRPVTETLRQLDDAALDEMRPTHFGVDWPARRVFAVLIDEQVHHGAEIALLRDLYRDRA